MQIINQAKYSSRSSKQTKASANNWPLLATRHIMTPDSLCLFVVVTRRRWITDEFARYRWNHVRLSSTRSNDDVLWFRLLSSTTQSTQIGNVIQQHHVFARKYLGQRCLKADWTLHTAADMNRGLSERSDPRDRFETFPASRTKDRSSNDGWL